MQIVLDFLASTRSLLLLIVVQISFAVFDISFSIGTIGRMCLVIVYIFGRSFTRSHAIYLTGQQIGYIQLIYQSIVRQFQWISIGKENKMDFCQAFTLRWWDRITWPYIYMYTWVGVYERKLDVPHCAWAFGIFNDCIPFVAYSSRFTFIIIILFICCGRKLAFLSDRNYILSFVHCFMRDACFTVDELSFSFCPMHI